MWLRPTIETKAIAGTHSREPGHAALHPPTLEYGEQRARQNGEGRKSWCCRWQTSEIAGAPPKFDVAQVQDGGHGTKDGLTVRGLDTHTLHCVHRALRGRKSRGSEQESRKRSWKINFRGLALGTTVANVLGTKVDMCIRS